jgi:hypothetical protein
MNIEITNLSGADKEIIEFAKKRIEMLCNEAKQIIGDYWVYVQESNDTLKADKKVGERVKDKMISFGPRLEKMSSGKYTKYNPNWVHYPYSAKRAKSKKAAQYGERIKTTANGEYKLSTLLRYSVGRDSTKIVDTEKRLMVIREKLEMFHIVIVSSDRRDKRISRITGVYNEVTSND